MKNVFVLGSLNMDYSLKINRMPFLGETISGENLMISPGGKGANQAVACARQNGQVHMVGSVGDDANGKMLIDNMTSNNIKVAGITKVDSCPSGAAFIFVTGGDNRIIVSGSANVIHNTANIKKYFIGNAAKGDILLLQYEIPLIIVEEIAAIAKELGMFVILNPAPAGDVSCKLCENIDMLVVNEIEYKTIYNKKFSTKSAVKVISKCDTRIKVVVTLGVKGSYYIHDGKISFYEAKQVKTVDSTAAGDTYIGTLAAGLANGLDADEALKRASIAAALTVMKRGAQVSIPSFNDVEQAINM